jgi:hypothetical protein
MLVSYKYLSSVCRPTNFIVSCIHIYFNFAFARYNKGQLTAVTVTNELKSRKSWNIIIIVTITSPHWHHHAPPSRKLQRERGARKILLPYMESNQSYEYDFCMRKLCQKGIRMVTLQTGFCVNFSLQDCKLIKAVFVSRKSMKFSDFHFLYSITLISCTLLT